MSTFKNRPNKVKYLSNVQTLDEIHKNKITKLNSNLQLLPQQKTELTNLEKRLKKLNTLKVSSTEDIKVKAEILTQINKLKSNIEKIEANNDLLDYISTAEDILVSYYDENCDQLDNNNSTIVKIEIDNTPKKIANGIYVSDKLKRLNEISQQKRKAKKPVKKRKLPQEPTSGKPIFNFIQTEPKTISRQTINRATLQEQYLILTDKNYACDKVRSSKMVFCDSCKIEKTLVPTEGCYVCGQCGATEAIVMENETLTYKDSIAEKQKYPYKKINHLREKLNQFQAKESSKVPDEICDKIRAELKKQRIDVKHCEPRHIKIILKRYKMTNYYEHLQQIYCDITKATPITLPKNTEEKLINMFQEMQDSFFRHCPKDRSNMLSYSYILNKYFRILDMENYADFFPLLQKEKLREQDMTWKKICRDMDWDFHSS